MFSLFINILLAIHIIVSLLIVLIVLMQRPKSEGIGAAFGGGMTENLFGAQTSNVLANATRWLGGIFFFLTLLLSILYARQSTRHSAIQEAAIKAAAAAGPVPSASPSHSLPGVTGTSVLSGTAATTGSAAESGTEEPFSGASVKLGAPAASPSLLAPAPLASPSPATTGTAGH